MPVRAPEDARPGTGRCFMSRTATSEKRRVFVEVHILLHINISLLKTTNVNTKLYISFEQLGMINMQPTRAIEIFDVLSKCGFLLHHYQSQPQSFLF